MHTQDERWSPVEPDVQVELAADVLPPPGRRDLIEQRGDRRVIGAGSWPEPAGQWWRSCQSHPPRQPKGGRRGQPPPSRAYARALVGHAGWFADLGDLDH